MSKQLSPTLKHARADTCVQRTTIALYVSDDARSGRVNVSPSHVFRGAGAMSTEGLTDGNSILRCKVTLSVTRCCDAHATPRNLHDKTRTVNERSMSVPSNGRVALSFC
jgi:hypothetical protein